MFGSSSGQKRRTKLTDAFGAEDPYVVYHVEAESPRRNPVARRRRTPEEDWEKAFEKKSGNARDCKCIKFGAKKSTRRHKQLRNLNFEESDSEVEQPGRNSYTSRTRRTATRGETREGEVHSSRRDRSHHRRNRDQLIGLNTMDNKPYVHRRKRSKSRTSLNDIDFYAMISDDSDKDQSFVMEITPPPSRNDRDFCPGRDESRRRRNRRERPRREGSPLRRNRREGSPIRSRREGSPVRHNFRDVKRINLKKLNGERLNLRNMWSNDRLSDDNDSVRSPMSNSPSSRSPSSYVSGSPCLRMNSPRRLRSLRGVFD